MPEHVPGTASDIRSRIAAMIQGDHVTLAGGVATALAAAHESAESDEWQRCADALIRLFVSALEPSPRELPGGLLVEVSRCLPRGVLPAFLDAIHRAERFVLGEAALDGQLGLSTDSWPIVEHLVRRATLDITAAYTELETRRSAPALVRDPLTTLIAAPVFAVALEQELERAARNSHAMSLALFDIDDLSAINRRLGYGVGERVLERFGITARGYFRTHDWVARHGGDSIAVLLPETTLDQAGLLAERFRDTVEQRIVLDDPSSGDTVAFTISACVAGSDAIAAGVNAAALLQRAEAAVAGAKLDGDRRVRQIVL